jgi:tRNA (guanine-N7-)-methyltransferase
VVRAAKTPKYTAFNSALNAFGRFAQEPKKWTTYLDPELPINLELGCGKAEVSLALAQKYPEQNFLGVDLKADRLYRASKTALEIGLDNTAFIQANILDIQEFIRPKTVNMIWLTHPDPFPKDRQAKHRMLNRNFLDIYKNILQADGRVRFKTDNRALFDWALEYLAEQSDVQVIDKTFDLHAERADEDLLIETTYTKKHVSLGANICYLEFIFI